MKEVFVNSQQSMEDMANWLAENVSGPRSEFVLSGITGPTWKLAYYTFISVDQKTNQHGFRAKIKAEFENDDDATMFLLRWQ
jgi:hypothetical protein